MTIAEPKKIVLLVDDAPANIRMATAMLRDAYEIRSATDGAMALDLARATPAPDLILLDVMMAGMDGYEVCTRLKADPETRDIPVIFVTGQTEITDESKGFQVGAARIFRLEPPIYRLFLAAGLFANVGDSRRFWDTGILAEFDQSLAERV